MALFIVVIIIGILLSTLGSIVTVIGQFCINPKKMVFKRKQ